MHPYNKFLLCVLLGVLSYLGLSFVVWAFFNHTIAAIVVLGNILIFAAIVACWWEVLSKYYKGNKK